MGLDLEEDRLQSSSTMDSLYERMPGSHYDGSTISYHSYEYLDIDNFLNCEPVVRIEDSSKVRDEIEKKVRSKRSLRERCDHVLTRDAALTFAELVLLIVSTILLTQIDSDERVTTIVSFSNVVFLTFINLSAFRLISIMMQWHITKKLIILMNSLGAVLIGGSGGMIISIWFETRGEQNLLLAESLLTFSIPFVYLVDIAYLVSSLKSLTF